MNLAGLQRKLIAAARANPPSDRVPFAFEKRILAQLRARAAAAELDDVAGVVMMVDVDHFYTSANLFFVIPAKAGIQCLCFNPSLKKSSQERLKEPDTGLRRYDEPC